MSGNATRRALAALALLAGVIASGQTQVQAQGTDDSFKGKQLTILVGGTAGGGIDIGARLMSRHLGRHLPGSPTVVAQLMPGAGGVRLLEHLIQAAPRDGRPHAAPYRQEACA